MRPPVQSGTLWLKEIFLFYVFEIPVRIDLQLSACGIVSHDDGMRVHLEATDSPHVVNRLFHTVTKGTRLVVTVYHDHHLLGIHHRAYTYCECCLWHQVHIVVKETAVSDDSISGKGLLTGTALEAGARFVECYVTIGANATHEQVNTACLPDSFLIVLAFRLQILGITVEDMHILLFDIDVAEEVVPHEGVIAFWMIFGKVHILVHIERDHVPERHLASLVQGYQLSVHPKGRAPRRTSQLEGLLLRRISFVDSLGYIVCSPLRHLFVVGFNN